MKKMLTSSLKAVALVAGLLSLAVSVQATVYTPGQQVKDFVTNEDAGIITAPSLTTDDLLDNWAYGSYNDGNVIAYTDQRGWRAVFEIDAPAAGKYGVEVKLRTTTTNWMVAFTASQGLEASERASLEVAPEWTNMARPTKISTLEKTTNVVQEAIGNPEDEGYVPAITEDVYTFASGEWETVYVPVTLEAGHNYVTFWLCRTYQGIDALKGPEGSVNGFYVEAIKVLPQGSGDVADVLQKATLKLWQQRMYPTMITDGSANLAADYAQLLAAYAAATDYSGLNTTAVQNGIDAVTVREEDLRHGTGLILNSDSVAFALPYYDKLEGGSISENERGEYSDAPMVFEYTNGKTLTYKFTTTVDGIYYPMLYAGTQLSTNAHVNIYTEDMQTKLVDDWTVMPNTGNWQVYTFWSQPAVSSFEAEAGKTYYLTIYFENYVNVRGLYLLQVLQKPKTYEEMEAMKAQAEDFFALYQQGTNGFYSIGGDMTLVNALEDALAQASDLDESSTTAEITAAYYAMEDAIAKIEGAKKVNVIPNGEANVFNLANGEFASWRVEAAGNIGYGYKGGSVTYAVYAVNDAKYKATIGMSNQAEGGQVRVTASKDGIDYFTTVFDVPGTGNWNIHDSVYVEIPVPAGLVNIKLYGEEAAGNWVGNTYDISFAVMEGTEGEGSKAYEEGAKVYYETYSVENLKALIAQAETAAAEYTYPTYDLTKVEAVNKAVEKANEVLAGEDDVFARADAYQKLQAAIDDLPNSTKINWLAIPTTEENPFDLKAGSFNKWQVEGGGNIGYGYQGGSVTYYLNVTAADTYDMVLEMSNPAEGGSVRITVTQDDEEIHNQVYDVPNTGNWSVHQDVVATMALPQAYLKALIYGETAAGNWVGNIYAIKVVKSDGSGISNVGADEVGKKGVYTLQGVRVEGRLAKGLYIVDGKKILVR